MRVDNLACEAAALSYRKGDRQKVLDFLTELKPVQAAYVAAKIITTLGPKSVESASFLKDLEKLNRRIE